MCENASSQIYEYKLFSSVDVIYLHTNLTVISEGCGITNVCCIMSPTRLEYTTYSIPQKEHEDLHLLVNLFKSSEYS